MKEQKKYFETHYEVYFGTADLYAYFIEKGISLLRPKGLFSYIVANKWLRANYGKTLRKYLLTKQMEEIVDFGDLPVFTTAITYPCIIRVSNEKPLHEFVVSKVEALDFPSLDDYVKNNHMKLDPQNLTSDAWTLEGKQTEELLKKINNTGTSLEKYISNQDFRGIISGLTEAFVIDDKTKARFIDEDLKNASLIKQFLLGKNIKRYKPLKPEKNVILIPKGWTISLSGETKNKWKWFKESYPAIANHLEPFSEAAEKRLDKGEYWWELRACEYYPEFEKTKIIYPEICQRPEFSFDESGYYANNKCFIIPTKDKFLLGILNSSLMFFLFRTYLPKLQHGFFIPAYVILKNFPIRTINPADPADKARHDHMVALVTQMLDLNKRLQDAGWSRRRRSYQGRLRRRTRRLIRWCTSCTG